MRTAWSLGWFVTALSAVGCAVVAPAGVAQLRCVRPAVDALREASGALPAAYRACGPSLRAAL
jgi:hypothetical protein